MALITLSAFVCKHWIELFPAQVNEMRQLRSISVAKSRSN